MIWANILSVVILFALGFIYFYNHMDVTFDFGPLFLLELIGYFMLHELFHGIGFLIFAKDPKNIKFGITLEKGVFYTLCSERIGKKAIIVTLLFPIIFLSLITFILSLIINSPTLALLSIANLGGAIGDILMVILILKMPSDVEYIDYNNDVGCYLVSKHDLSKIKLFGIKYLGSGVDSDKNIKDIPRIYISKFSIVFLIIYFVLTFSLLFMKEVK